MKRDSQLAAYFEEAATWDADRAEQAERRVRVAWRVAVAAVVCSIASTLALTLLVPLKTVEPFVIRVDSRTGVVDVVPPYDGNGSLDETTTRYLISRYVSTCERFAWPTAELDYEECAAFHGAKRNQQWAASWSKTNPESPLNRYKDGTSVQVSVQGVTFFTRASGVQDLAQVRYLKGIRRGNEADEARSYWTATIQYAYVKPALDPRKRQWNPFGLRIVEFQAEAEAVSDRDLPRRDSNVPPAAGGGGQ